MTLIEKQGDILKCPPYVTIVQFCSADYAQGAGAVASEINKRGGCQRIMNIVGDHSYPDCIYAAPCLNLVVKARKGDEVQIDAIRKSLAVARETIRREEIKHIAMLYGEGTAGLPSWEQVRDIIVDVLKKEDITIYVFS